MMASASSSRLPPQDRPQARAGFRETTADGRCRPRSGSPRHAPARQHLARQRGQRRRSGAGEQQAARDHRPHLIFGIVQLYIEAASGKTRALDLSEMRTIKTESMSSARATGIAIRAFSALCAIFVLISARRRGRACDVPARRLLLLRAVGSRDRPDLFKDRDQPPCAASHGQSEPRPRSADQARSDHLHADICAGRERRGGRPHRRLYRRRVLLGLLANFWAICRSRLPRARPCGTRPSRSRSARHEVPLPSARPGIRQARRAQGYEPVRARSRHAAGQRAAGERIAESAVARGAASDPVLPDRRREIGERDREDARCSASPPCRSNSPACAPTALSRRGATARASTIRSHAAKCAT